MNRLFSQYGILITCSYCIHCRVHCDNGIHGETMTSRVASRWQNEAAANELSQVWCSQGFMTCAHPLHPCLVKAERTNLPSLFTDTDFGYRKCCEFAPILKKNKITPLGSKRSGWGDRKSCIISPDCVILLVSWVLWEELLKYLQHHSNPFCGIQQTPQKSLLLYAVGCMGCFPGKQVKLS